MMHQCMAQKAYYIHTITKNLIYKTHINKEIKSFAAMYSTVTCIIFLIVWCTCFRSWDGPLTFSLGEGSVIRALDMGLLDMCVGERRVIIAPSVLAYGRQGKG